MKFVRKLSKMVGHFFAIILILGLAQSDESNNALWQTLYIVVQVLLNLAIVYSLFDYWTQLVQKRKQYVGVN